MTDLRCPLHDVVTQLGGIPFNTRTVGLAL